jgi:hypothetical protein
MIDIERRPSFDDPSRFWLRKIPLSGGDARGRNGWFKGDSIEVADLGHDPDHIIALAVSSSRYADVQPIVLNLSPDEADALAIMLHEAAETQRARP